MNSFQFHRFKSSAAQQALVRYAHHVRLLRTQYFSTLQFFLRPEVDCRNLAVIDFPKPCHFLDPDIPRGLIVEEESDGIRNRKQPILSRAEKDSTQSSGPVPMDQDLVLEDIDMMISRNTHHQDRVRKAVGLFDENLLVTLLEKCSRLQSFTWVGFPFNHDQLINKLANKLMPSTTGLSTPTTAIGSFTSLRKLELTNQNYCRLKASSIEYLLNHCPPHLEELLLTISFGSRAEVDIATTAITITEVEQSEEQAVLDEESTMTTADQEQNADSMAMVIDIDTKSRTTTTATTMSLRKLAIRGDLSGPGNLIWLSLLRQCSQLRTVWVDIFKDTTLEQLASTLTSACPLITEISLQCMTARPQDDARIAEVIQASKIGWKNLSLSFFHGLGPLSTAALLKHSASLESLVLEECDGFGSDEVQAILSSCPNLRILRAMTSNGSHFTSTVYLDAREMIDSPWICHKLEELKLEITGFARPDQKIDQYDNPLTGPLHDGTIQGFDLQQLVYKQLGELRRLKVLWLGHDKQDLDDEENYFPLPDGRFKYIDPEVQHTCLEFSLKSGLALLAGLKDLRSLNLDRMKTRIGLGEIQWMVAQWPKLERIIGLVIQGDPVPKHVQWLYDNRPDIDLPPVLGSFTSGFI
ncbi:hypothetical protein BGZ83_001608 [Gryganskiella cystojenkinii]|nr:hypothetical protein BGZ83_001608 [Gryganskiella cystojenkinii]